MSDIFVVVCKNDIPHPKHGVDPMGEIVAETYTNGATREAAEEKCKQLAHLGECRIARLVFE